jgi:hypothetical protein
MKKFLYFLFLVPVTATGMYWPTEQDRPFTGLPPIATQVYRPPVNPLLRTPQEISCSGNGCNRGISRKDIIKQARSTRNNKCGNRCTIRPTEA